MTSNLKNHIPPEKKSGTYQINCKDCEKYSQVSGVLCYKAIPVN